MDINTTFKSIAQYKRLIEEAEKELTALENQVKEYMTETGVETLLGDEHKATYKAVTANRFDSTAFKKEHADMYEQYKKETKSMRFTFA